MPPRTFPNYGLNPLGTTYGAHSPLNISVNGYCRPCPADVVSVCCVYCIASLAEWATVAGTKVGTTGWIFPEDQNIQKYETEAMAAASPGTKMLRGG